MPAMEDRIQVRVGTKTAEWLTDRAKRMHGASPDRQARDELGLWQDALDAELRRMRFAVAELNCVADVLNGTLLQPGVALSVPVVYADASDAFSFAPPPSSYGEKWEIDEQSLLEKLRGLGPTADHALHDAVSRWWDQGCQPTAEGWAAVGLRVTDGKAKP
jgi:hypothetical protein